MKSIKKSTLLELARLTRKYAKTGDVDILPKKIAYAQELAKQAYGGVSAWSAFDSFLSAVVGVFALKPRCSNEELCELFKLLGFEVVENET